MLFQVLLFCSCLLAWLILPALAVRAKLLKNLHLLEIPYLNLCNLTRQCDCITSILLR